VLLNKAPDHLHRFYNNSSSFVHGGLDASNRDVPMAIGQKQIHNKIQQLNFRDCHAKISQVDAQATLGSGVVVQVTGELSNAGQPMRRFTQTFVLAAQSPKKYYVHNDIFRYQDFYSEDECEENGRSEVEEESQEIENTVDQSVLNAPQTIYYSSNVLTSAPNVLPNYSQQQPQQPPTQQQLNGLGHEESNLTQSPPMVTGPEPNNVSQSIMETDQSQYIETEDKISEPDESEQKDVYEVPVVEEKPEPIISQQVVSNEPKTWSNLVKSGATSSTVMSFASSIGGSSSTSVMHSSSAMSPPPAKFLQDQSSRFDPPLGATGPGLSSKQPLAQRPNRERRTSNSNTTTQNQQFNDSQQLFLGNIPHHASEDELKTLFSRFGTVLELRILSKQGQKIQGQRPPPNYGFITYEDSVAVQECLANLPLYFPDNSPDGQKLNVEEKKTRTRAPGETGGRIGGGNNYGNNMGSNLPRSMGTGPGQQTRNTQQRGGNVSGGIGQNRGGPFNRDRGAPLGQRNAGSMNAGNNGNTYNRR